MPRPAIFVSGERWLPRVAKQEKSRVEAQLDWRYFTQEALERRPPDAQEMLRAFAVHIESVREAERTRIAREVHDQLGQALTGLRMDLAWLEKRLPGDLAAPAGKIRSMLRLVDDTMQSVRRIAAELRPLVLDDADLPGAIRWEARRFKARSGVRCRLELPAEQFVMDPDRATAVFRIFQEAMTNVARHARATRVDIRLQLDAGRLLLSVADNGVGISPAALHDPKALGLLGMRERALLLGGKVEIGGSEGGGTSVSLSVPLRLPVGARPLRE